MDSTGTGTGTGTGAGAIDKFLHAIENATIGACRAWSADASLDATVPNWRLHASGADAIRAEYARWFADPGHFDEPNRHRIAGGYDGDGRASELIEYTQRDPRLLAAECLWLDSVHAEVAEHPHGQRLHGPIKPRSWPRRQTKPTASGNSALGAEKLLVPGLRR